MNDDFRKKVCKSFVSPQTMTLNSFIQQSEYGEGTKGKKSYKDLYFEKLHSQPTNIPYSQNRYGGQYSTLYQKPKQVSNNDEMTYSTRAKLYNSEGNNSLLCHKQYSIYSVKHEVPRTKSNQFQFFTFIKKYPSEIRPKTKRITRRNMTYIDVKWNLAPPESNSQRRRGNKKNTVSRNRNRLRLDSNDNNEEDEDNSLFANENGDYGNLDKAAQTRNKNKRNIDKEYDANPLYASFVCDQCVRDDPLMKAFIEDQNEVMEELLATNKLNLSGYNYDDDEDGYSNKDYTINSNNDDLDGEAGLFHKRRDRRMNTLRSVNSSFNKKYQRRKYRFNTFNEASIANKTGNDASNQLMKVSFSGNATKDDFNKLSPNKKSTYHKSRSLNFHLKNKNSNDTSNNNELESGQDNNNKNGDSNNNNSQGYITKHCSSFKGKQMDWNNNEKENKQNVWLNSSTDLPNFKGEPIIICEDDINIWGKENDDELKNNSKKSNLKLKSHNGLKKGRDSKIKKAIKGANQDSTKGNKDSTNIDTIKNESKSIHMNKFDNYENRQLKNKYYKGSFVKQTERKVSFQDKKQHSFDAKLKEEKNNDDSKINLKKSNENKECGNKLRSQNKNKKVNIPKPKEQISKEKEKENENKEGVKKNVMFDTNSIGSNKNLERNRKKALSVKDNKEKDINIDMKDKESSKKELNSNQSNNNIHDKNNAVNLLLVNTAKTEQNESTENQETNDINNPLNRQSFNKETNSKQYNSLKNSKENQLINDSINQLESINKNKENTDISNEAIDNNDNRQNSQILSNHNQSIMNQNDQNLNNNIGDRKDASNLQSEVLTTQNKEVEDQLFQNDNNMNSLLKRNKAVSSFEKDNKENDKTTVVNAEEPKITDQLQKTQSKINSMSSKSIDNSDERNVNQNNNANANDIGQNNVYTSDKNINRIQHLTNQDNIDTYNNDSNMQQTLSSMINANKNTKSNPVLINNNDKYYSSNYNLDSNKEGFENIKSKLDQSMKNGDYPNMNLSSSNNKDNIMYSNTNTKIIQYPNSQLNEDNSLIQNEMPTKGVNKKGNFDSHNLNTISSLSKSGLYKDNVIDLTNDFNNIDSLTDTKNSNIQYDTNPNALKSMDVIDKTKFDSMGLAMTNIESKDKDNTQNEPINQLNYPLNQCSNDKMINQFSNHYSQYSDQQIPIITKDRTKDFNNTDYSQESNKGTDNNKALIETNSKNDQIFRNNYKEDKESNENNQLFTNNDNQEDKVSKENSQLFTNNDNQEDKVSNENNQLFTNNDNQEDNEAENMNVKTKSNLMSKKEGQLIKDNNVKELNTVSLLNEDKDRNDNYDKTNKTNMKNNDFNEEENIINRNIGDNDIKTSILKSKKLKTTSSDKNEMNTQLNHANRISERNKEIEVDNTEFDIKLFQSNLNDNPNSINNQIDKRQINDRSNHQIGEQNEQEGTSIMLINKDQLDDKQNGIESNQENNYYYNTKKSSSSVHQKEQSLNKSNKHEKNNLNQNNNDDLALNNKNALNKLQSREKDNEVFVKEQGKYVKQGKDKENEMNNAKLAKIINENQLNNTEEHYNIDSTSKTFQNNDQNMKEINNIHNKFNNEFNTQQESIFNEKIQDNQDKTSAGFIQRNKVNNNNSDTNKKDNCNIQNSTINQLFVSDNNSNQDNCIDIKSKEQMDDGISNSNLDKFFENNNTNPNGHLEILDSKIKASENAQLNNNQLHSSKFTRSNDDNNTTNNQNQNQNIDNNESEKYNQIEINNSQYKNNNPTLQYINQNYNDIINTQNSFQGIDSNQEQSFQNKVLTSNILSEKCYNNNNIDNIDELNKDKEIIPNISTQNCKSRQNDNAIDDNPLLSNIITNIPLKQFDNTNILLNNYDNNNTMQMDYNNNSKSAKMNINEKNNYINQPMTITDKAISIGELNDRCTDQQNKVIQNNNTTDKSYATLSQLNQPDLDQSNKQFDQYRKSRNNSNPINTAVSKTNEDILQREYNANQSLSQNQNKSANDDKSLSKKLDSIENTEGENQWNSSDTYTNKDNMRINKFDNQNSDKETTKFPNSQLKIDKETNTDITMNNIINHDLFNNEIEEQRNNNNNNNLIEPLSQMKIQGIQIKTILKGNQKSNKDNDRNNNVHDAQYIEYKDEDEDDDDDKENVDDIDDDDSKNIKPIYKDSNEIVEVEEEFDESLKNSNRHSKLSPNPNRATIDSNESKRISQFNNSQDSPIKSDQFNEKTEPLMCQLSKKNHQMSNFNEMAKLHSTIEAKVPTISTLNNNDKYDSGIKNNSLQENDQMISNKIIKEEMNKGKKINYKSSNNSNNNKAMIINSQCEYIGNEYVITTFRITIEKDNNNQPNYRFTLALTPTKENSIKVKGNPRHNTQSKSFNQALFKIENQSIPRIDPSTEHNETKKNEEESYHLSSIKRDIKFDNEYSNCNNNININNDNDNNDNNDNNNSNDNNDNNDNNDGKKANDNKLNDQIESLLQKIKSTHKSEDIHLAIFKAQKDQEILQLKQQKDTLAKKKKLNQPNTSNSNSNSNYNYNSNNTNSENQNPKVNIDDYKSYNNHSKRYSTQETDPNKYFFLKKNYNSIEQDIQSSSNSKQHINTNFNTERFLKEKTPYMIEDSFPYQNSAIFTNPNIATSPNHYNSTNLNQLSSFNTTPITSKLDQLEFYNQRRKDKQDSVKITQKSKPGIKSVYLNKVKEDLKQSSSKKENEKKASGKQIKQALFPINRKKHLLSINIVMPPNNLEDVLESKDYYFIDD